MRHLTVEQRAQIVGMSLAGSSNKSIARAFSIDMKTVARWINRYHLQQNFQRLPGSGRKPKIDKRMARRVGRIVLANRFTTAPDIAHSLGLEGVSDKTVIRSVKEVTGFENYWAAKKPFISEINRRRRVEWCRAHQDMTIDDWRRVLWSDESPFVLRFNRRRRCWRAHNERYNPMCITGTVKHDVKLNVWGCFTAHGVGNLYLVNGILEQIQYRNIITTQMIPSVRRLFPEGDWIFQQDNDPKHTAHSVRALFRDMAIPVLPWPSQSPDLNPIENLWSILDYNLRNRRPQNKEELFQVLCDGWNALDRDLKIRLVDPSCDR